MLTDPAQVERLNLLAPADGGEVSACIQVLRASYLRQVPKHYAGNPSVRELIDIQVILVEGGVLGVPFSPQTSFLGFYQAVRRSDPALFRQLLLPSGAAKAAANDCVTPIKVLTQLELEGRRLPGEPEQYGWDALEKEQAGRGLDLQVLFQGNGLYFNRGSALFDGERLLAYPDAFLAERWEAGMARGEAEELAVSEHSLKRPLLFFLLGADGKMSASVHHFDPHETYRAGLARLEADLRQRQVRAGLAASPALILPGEDGQPLYLTRDEVLSRFYASDVRHYFYCPYEGAVLLSCELSRLQSLHPERMAASFSERPQDTVRLHMKETLRAFSVPEMARILDARGYADHWAFAMGTGPEGKPSRSVLQLKPLEGVYSHLVPFLTRLGRFGLLQTSGTHGNKTGNDGPTLRQLLAILQDLNAQAPFDQDPIIAAASGSQGNDVPNVVCRDRRGGQALLHELAPGCGVNEDPSPRGVVTTPRVGIVVPRVRV